MHRLASLVTITVLVWSLAAAQDEPPAGRRGGRANIREFLGLGPPPDAAAAARGEKLWAPNCAFCHGAKARGAEGPNLIRSTIVLKDDKGELIGPAILKGRPDRGMPAFESLSEGQLYDLSQFLHLQVELVANRGSYKRLNVVTGNAKTGETFFNGAGRCKSCHNPTGDLAKIGTKLQPDQLQTRWIWPGGGGFGAGPAKAKKARITLASGQTISGTIKRIDDLDVSLYDDAGDYHSWPRSTVKVYLVDELADHRKILETLTDAQMHDVTAYLVTLK